jgi:hypothetical protein
MVLVCAADIEYDAYYKASASIVNLDIWVRPVLLTLLLLHGISEINYYLKSVQLTR